MRNRIDIKEESKGIIRSARVSPLLVTAIVMAVTFLLNRVIDLVEGGSMLYSYQLNWEYFRAVMERDPYAVQTLLDSIPEITGHSFFFSTLVSLFTVVLNGGYYVYCIGIRRGAEMPYATLLDGLSVAGKLIWCWLQITVKIFLWSMLFVIPGIIAAYRYRFAYYNVLSDDSLSAGDAIRLSCRQTQGYKGELFMLDLSFIGWSLLSSLTMGLLNVWLTPYMTLCDLAYFEDAQRRLGASPYREL